MSASYNFLSQLVAQIYFNLKLSLAAGSIAVLKSQEYALRKFQI